MRLTLRTLLAYLDDVLEPSQTKLMGQKIQESPVAGTLVSRIREVMRRRRLSAPDVSGSSMGIDPNIVAQYLDNTLPADQVADVERVLLASDELLAEVAACHQVLTLVLGEPCEVTEASRERLYALGPVAPSDQLRVEEPTPASAMGSDPSSMPTGTIPQNSKPQPTPATEIPDYLRPNPWSQRIVPTAVVALLVLLCVGLLVTDPGFVTGLRQAKRELAKSSRESTTANNTATPEPTDKSLEPGALSEIVLSQNEPTMSPASASISGPAAAGTPLPRGLDPAPPPDEPESPTSPAPASNKNSSTIDQPAKADLPANVALTTKPKQPAPPEPGPPVAATPKPVVAVPAVDIQYTSSEGALLHFDETKGHWFLLPHRSVVKAGELLACLEPFEAGLDLNRGSLRVTVLGESMILVSGPSDLAPVGFDIRRGRVILQGSSKGTQRPTPYTVTVGQDTWKVEFLSPETVCAIEIIPREPAKFEKLHDSNWYLGTLYVLSGAVKWTSSTGAVQEIADHKGISLAPTNEAPAVKAVPISFPSSPDWTDAQKRKSSPLRRYGALFEKEFELDQPAEQSMQSMIRHPVSKVEELAVRGLALTEAYSATVQALAECSHEEGRFAARDGLRFWLPMNADHGTLLKKELEMHYPPADSDAVYRMLWGFTRDDGKDRVTSQQFVTWLRSPHVEIRELADYWIERLIGRKTEFRATNVPTQREPQVRRIEKQIEDDGALIKGE